MVNKPLIRPHFGGYARGGWLISHYCTDFGEIPRVHNDGMYKKMCDVCGCMFLLQIHIYICVCYKYVCVQYQI